MMLCIPAMAQPVLTGAAAYGDWRSDAPGVRRHLTAADLPPPYASRSSSNSPGVVAPPAGALPREPAGFSVSRFATGLSGPRLLRVAPNGDIFVSETFSGRVRVLRAADGAATAQDMGVFAKLEGPFGIAFYPPGPNPAFIVIAERNRVIRFPYRTGDVRPSGPPQLLVPELSPTSGHHATRDVVFSRDGLKMFVSVGSGSNVAEGMRRLPADQIAAWQAASGVGATWGNEERRAAVLAFDPSGRGERVFAAGLRNCVGMAIHPTTGDLWCATNERDGMGDNLPPDYVTHVQEGGFYGWPWFYTGGHEDPRHPNERPDLATASLVPDVLIQPHSAPLQMLFYPPDQTGSAAFPQSYRGDAFVALHGSWNRSKRTGYKIVRIPMRNGVASGDYEDFLTGFVTNDDDVWARPVGVAVARDGALLVSDDASGTIWRVAAIPGARVASP